MPWPSSSRPSPGPPLPLARVGAADAPAVVASHAVSYAGVAVGCRARPMTRRRSASSSRRTTPRRASAGRSTRSSTRSSARRASTPRSCSSTTGRRTGPRWPPPRRPRAAFRYVSSRSRTADGFEARRAGLEAATGDWVLSARQSRDDRTERAGVRQRRTRTQARPSGRRTSTCGRTGISSGCSGVSSRSSRGPHYFDNPRTTSFGAADFDRYPKGTTCFFGPRDVLLEAIDAFRSRYADSRVANDDTPILRWIAAAAADQHLTCRTPATTSRGYLSARSSATPSTADRCSSTATAEPESALFPVVVAVLPALAAWLCACPSTSTFRRRPALAVSSVASASVPLAVVRHARSRRSPCSHPSMPPRTAPACGGALAVAVRSRLCAVPVVDGVARRVSGSSMCCRVGRRRPRGVPRRQPPQRSTALQTAGGKLQPPVEELDQRLRQGFWPTRTSAPPDARTESTSPGTA